MPRNLITSDRLMVKLRYNDSTFIDSTTTIATFVWRANSPFDPQFTTGGGQPPGFDQWATLYERYHVVASKFTAVITPGTNNTSNTIAVVLPSTLSSGVDLNTYMSSAYTRWKALPASTQGGNQISTISNYMTTSKVFGLPKSQRQDPRYSALVNANPLAEWYWLFAFGNYAGQSQNINYSYTIQITYYIVFYDRRRVVDV